MQRARRLASAVVVASLAVGGLSACRSEPTVAAYIGDSAQVSEQQVQAIWDEAYESLTARAPEEEAGKPVQMPFTRADIVHSLITRELYGRVADQRRVDLPAGLPYEEGGAQQNLPADSEYVHLYVENVVLQNLLLRSVQSSTPPADADMRTVFDQLAANGGVDPGQSYDAWKAGASPEIRQAVAAAGTIRDEVQEVASDLGVKVNPRYQPFEVSVLEVRGQNATLDLLTTQFGNDESVPVADVS